jgi:hypothetical protein
VIGQAGERNIPEAVSLLYNPPTVHELLTKTIRDWLGKYPLLYRPDNWRRGRV